MGGAVPGLLVDLLERFVSDLSYFSRLHGILGAFIPSTLFTFKVCESLSGSGVNRN